MLQVSWVIYQLSETIFGKWPRFNGNDSEVDPTYLGPSLLTLKVLYSFWNPNICELIMTWAFPLNIPCVLSYLLTIKNDLWQMTTL